MDEKVVSILVMILFFIVIWATVAGLSYLFYLVGHFNGLGASCLILMGFVFTVGLIKSSK